ncbi:MAG: cysteine desulfurase family protein, partial [Sphingomonadaceae bacterium]
ANPSSAHSEGRAARAGMERARADIAATLGWRPDIRFTSGATEAIGLVLARVRTEALFASAAEHAAFRRAARAPEPIPVTREGIVEPERVAEAIAGAERPLVAVQAVNNETGVIQPLDEIAPVVAEAGGLLFADCVQSAGKIPLPDADFISISAHKVGGPPGVGALLVKDLGALAALSGQEKGYRPGTQNLPAIMGFAAAVGAGSGWLSGMAALRARLEEAIGPYGAEIAGGGAPRMPTIALYRMPGVRSEMQLVEFDLAGIAVSVGSACSSGSMKPSPVLSAMGWSEDEAREVIRVSFGRGTGEADVDAFAEAWRALASKHGLEPRGKEAGGEMRAASGQAA